MQNLEGCKITSQDKLIRRCEAKQKCKTQLPYEQGTKTELECDC